MPSPTALGPFPYLPAEFDKDGTAVHDEQLAAITAAVAPDRADRLTDLFVISHGWNDDIPDAEELYQRIFDHVATVLQTKNAVTDAVNGRRAAVVGVLWPSKKFDESELIPGGAAAMPVSAVEGLQAALDTLGALVDTPDGTAALTHARTLVPHLADSLDARDEFVRVVRAFMPHEANAEEPVIADEFYTMSGDQLLQRLSRPAAGARPPARGGGAAGFTDWVGKAVDGGRALANLVTYYQMKGRAGDVGQRGVYRLLRAIRDLRPASDAEPLRLHLIGHSFGCRLVTAAAAGPTGAPPLPVDTLILCQAAFSHFSFSQAYDGTHDGFFRRVVTDPARVLGPILITFTAQDKAVGLAYPIASRIARQIAAAIGDANDPYGGLGRNGAQKTPGAQTVTLAAAGTPYAFAARGIYNLDANAVITAHSDLGHDEVAWAILSGVVTPAAGGATPS